MLLAVGGSVPRLPMQRGQHPHKSIRDLRLGRESPSGQIPLREQGQVILLPARVMFGGKYATIGKASIKPKALTLRGAIELLPKQRRKLH